MVLKITNNKDGNTLTVLIEGRLDTSTAPELESNLRDSLDGVAALNLDLEKLEYISSAGLRVLLAAQKIMNKQGEMKILHVSEAVREIFEITGFDAILTIE